MVYGFKQACYGKECGGNAEYNLGSIFKDQRSEESKRRCMRVTQMFRKFKRIKAVLWRCYRRITVVARQCYGGVIDVLPWYQGSVMEVL